MRLKSIDIQGFKSFPDRTQLEFDQGVTAVIGPNGSGKSNIADAVRWVLGEQSTKALRGGKMEDVIFGGTQSRKAQGVASVTLVIDNTDRSLACDADEVAVMRRLYRSGDSEYRINGAAVRLRDVNELFMDTGLGRDGYSIIGQGRVAEIVSARSRERREIFEEAAGISKFRYRKTEAERRLQLAEDNLLRLRDILAELEGRVGPLKAQSDKAARYLEYAGEKKGLEISLWVRSIGVLHTKIASVEDKLLLTQREHDEAKELVEQCESDFSAELEKGRLLSAEIDSLRVESAQLTKEASDAESEEAVRRNDVLHYKKAAEEAEQAAALAGRSQSELKNAASSCEEKLVCQQDERTVQANAACALEEEIIRQDAVLSEITQRGGQLRLRRAAAFEAIDAARIDAAASATALGEGEERLHEMSEARRRSEEACETALREKEECEALLREIEEEFVSLENAAGGYLLKGQSRRQKLDALAEKQTVLSREIETKRQRARVLTDLDKNMEGFGPSVRFVLQRARAGTLGGVRGPVSSLLRVNGEYAAAVETALGAAVQNIVVENEEAAKRAIALLKQEKAGRATFLPMTSVHGQKLDVRSLEGMYGYVGLACDLTEYDPVYEGMMTALLGRVAVAEDLDAAVVIARKHNYRFRIVTLDGQVVNAGGSMTGGFSSRSAGVIGRKKEIEDLLSQVKGLEEKKALLDAEADSLQKELASLDAEVDAIEAQKTACREDRVRCETQLSHLKQDIENIQKQRAAAEKEREALSARIEEARGRCATSEELTRTLAEQLDGLQKQIAENDEEKSEAVAEAGALREKLTGQTTALTLLDREIERTQEELSRLRESLAAGEEERFAHLEKAAALQKEIDTANAEADALRERREAALQKALEKRDAASQKTRERDESERRCSVLRGEEKTAAARRDDLYREVVRLTEQKTTAEGEQSALVARLYDDYELTRSDAEELAKPVEDVPAANRRLSELRAKIKSLGSVNVGAIDEYREVSARYKELSAQLRDVEGSKSELARLISELTGQMCEIFSKKFSEIDQNFRRIFAELFEGGSASLSLTDPSDLLESGIEISVHPPGKLIKNLAALSGGEQSFVAIAIFFSILKVNPAPFCLLDEIEAALDDVNVAKYAAYLHRLTDKTQFIAITHRRGTLEEADVLYGVTRHEEGVSKLLRLDVSEIEKTLQTKNHTQEG